MHEKKLNNKCYKVSLWPKLFLYSLFLLSASSAPYMLRDKQYILFAISTVCGIICLISAIWSNFIKIIIKNDSILKLHKYPKRSYKIRFDEIGQIIDDDASTLGISLHVFHLVPKENIKKSFKRFTIHTGYKNRRELMSEVISRIPADTYVEDSVYDFIKAGKNKPLNPTGGHSQ